MNYIYGLSPVLEALRAGKRPVQTLYILVGAQTSRLSELIDVAKRARIPIERRERRDLDEMTRRANHQGVVALLGANKGQVAKAQHGDYTDAETILASLSAQPLLVLLDNIEDPHNLGAILRSCDGAGVDGVFIPEHR
ncbi:MAG TPA: RNA methyltransferase substrate-binding domain-containing protein, partial [Blastocatellia bacterium]|nr:RNA methyltransferase substrate-binding domain-containing protein [Blastocatellia bacterium]